MSKEEQERIDRIDFLLDTVFKNMRTFSIDNPRSGVEFYEAVDKRGFREFVFRVNSECDFEDVKCPHDEVLKTDFMTLLFQWDEEHMAALKKERGY